MSYTSYKEINGFYDAVRIELDIDEKTLPNNSIDLFTKAPYAENHVKNEVGNLESLSEEKIMYFKNAVVKCTALQCSKDNCLAVKLDKDMQSLIRKIKNTHYQSLSMFRTT